MQNLLSRFNPASFTIATIRRRHTDHTIEKNDDFNLHYVLSTLENIRLIGKFDIYWRNLQIHGAVEKILRLVEELHPKVIVGVFPSYQFLLAARAVAKRAQIPWIAYLHDTIAEALSGSKLGKKSKTLQKQVFQEASSILVMNQGMSELYERKYGLFCKPLEHCYLEPIPKKLLTRKTTRQQALLAGGICGTNVHSIRRVSHALQNIGWRLLLLTDTTLKILKKQQIFGSHVRTAFYERRQEYLDVLSTQSILILALNWPDETSMHEDELVSCFPTKTPEFLASGRPIIVHCPEYYFLAEFFRKNSCGYVVSKRSEDSIATAIRHVNDNPGRTDEMRLSALSVSRLFNAERITRNFRDEIDRVAGLEWGKKANRAK